MSLSLLFRRTRVSGNATTALSSGKRRHSVCFLNPTIQKESSIVYDDQLESTEDLEEPIGAYFYSNGRLQTPEEHRMFVQSTEVVSTEYHNDTLCLSEIWWMLLLLYYYYIPHSTNLQLSRLWGSLYQTADTKPGRKRAVPFPTIVIALKEGILDMFQFQVDTEKLRDLMRESERLFHGKQIEYDSDSESVFSVFSDSGDSTHSLGVFSKFDFSELVMERPDEQMRSQYDPLDFVSIADGCLHLTLSRFPKSPRPMSRESSVEVHCGQQSWHRLGALQPVMSMVNTVMDAGLRILDSYSSATAK